MIVQVGISEVVYVNWGDDSDTMRASRILLKLAGVRLRQYTPCRTHITLDFWKPLNETERQEATMRASKETTDSRPLPEHP